LFLELVHVVVAQHVDSISAERVPDLHARGVLGSAEVEVAELHDPVRVRRVGLREELLDPALRGRLESVVQVGDQPEPERLRLRGCEHASRNERQGEGRADAREESPT